MTKCSKQTSWFSNVTFMLTLWIIVSPKIITSAASSSKNGRRSFFMNALDCIQSTISSDPMSAKTSMSCRGGAGNNEMKSVSNTEEDDDGKIPTLFNLAEEAIYDRYAACLAATEGLRRMRDKEISKAKPGFLSRKKSDKEGEERANSKYVMNSSKIIRALGLSVPQFNQLGREVMKNDELKEKVIEQAFIYRIASTLTIPDNRVQIITDSKSSQLLNAHRRRRIQMFAQSISEIEELRQDQIDRLRRALQIPALPDGINICDPKLTPLLSPKVRAVCEAFPLQAEEIVRKYGLNSDEFNEMLEKTKTNPIFREKVKNELISKASKEQK